MKKGFIWLCYFCFKQLLNLLDNGCVCCRILYDKRFSVFHYPVTDEDAPNYRSIIQNPMDIATLLQRVDSGQYFTCSSFLQDVDLVVTNAKVWVCQTLNAISSEFLFFFRFNLATHRCLLSIVRRVKPFPCV